MSLDNRFLTNYPTDRDEQRQRNIDDNIFNVKKWAQRTSRPQYWPKHWKYPCDPQTPHLSHTETFPHCINCGKPAFIDRSLQELYPQHCKCELSEGCDDFVVEVIELPRRKSNPNLLNRGVRLLTPVKEGHYLACYTGEIVPLEVVWCEEDIYAIDPLEPHDPLATNTDNDARPIIAKISARIYGNWTRYLNHSTEKA